MISKAELKKIWTEIIPQEGNSIGRRVDVKHPLDFFVTYDEVNHMQFILLTDIKPSLPESSSQILVRCNQRTDGKYAICFSLVNKGLRDQYISLCWDILDSTYVYCDKKQGIMVAIKHFKMWKKLFERFSENNLSENQIKGLIGELTVLRELCVPRYGLSAAVSGWIGPIGADRDFEYLDFWYESKCTSLSADKVIISSFDQLDTDNEGFLVIVRVEKASQENEKRITLRTLVDSLRDVLLVDENVQMIFNNRLSLVGYRESDNSIDDPYIIHKIEKYRVDNDTFPRIRRSMIHTALSDGQYCLSIPALQPWKTEVFPR